VAYEWLFPIEGVSCCMQYYWPAQNRWTCRPCHCRLKSPTNMSLIQDAIMTYEWLFPIEGVSCCMQYYWPAQNRWTCRPCHCRLKSYSPDVQCTFEFSLISLCHACMQNARCLCVLLAAKEYIPHTASHGCMPLRVAGRQRIYTAYS
jgi:hypothetical protein